VSRRHSSFAKYTHDCFLPNFSWNLPCAPSVWQMPTCRRDGPQKNAMSFQIVSPADGTSLPVYPRDFCIFPRQLCYYSSLLGYRFSFDKIMAAYRLPTMRVGEHPTQRGHSSSAAGASILCGRAAECRDRAILHRHLNDWLRAARGFFFRSG
jgi:hypothetical protein